MAKQKITQAQESPANADGWIPVTFTNSWVNYDTTTFGACAYRKDASGTVFLKGLVKTGTMGTGIFTLPAGYRPEKTCHIATIANGAFAGINIAYATGIVMAQYGSNVWFSLDGISFLGEL